MSEKISPDIIKSVSSKSTRKRGEVENKKAIKKLLYNTSEAAESLGLSEGYLANLRSQGRGPKFYKVGTKPLYTENDLLEWATECPILTADSVRLERD